MTNPELTDVVIRSCVDRLLKSRGHIRPIFRMYGFEKVLKWNRTIPGIEAVKTEGFVWQREHLFCIELSRPTADGGETLGFRKVGLLPAQLLCEQLLLGHIHGCTDKPFEEPLFHNGNCHGADVAHLPIGSDDPLYLIKATVLLLHAFDGFSDGGSVLRMDKGKILFNRRCAILRIKTVDLVQLIRPIMA